MGLLEGFNSKYPTSTRSCYIWEFPWLGSGYIVFRHKVGVRDFPRLKLPNVAVGCLHGTFFMLEPSPVRKEIGKVVICLALYV